MTRPDVAVSAGHAGPRAGEETGPDRAAARDRPLRVAAGATTGVVCGGIAIGVGQLVAGAVNPDASPIVVVGQSAIDLTPEWLKGWAIRTFGSNDKTVLLTGIAVVLGLVAIALGVASMRRVWVGIGGLAVLGCVGVAAAWTRPVSDPADALPSIAGAVAAGAALVVLRRRAPHAPPATGDPAPAPPGAFDRRRFLMAGAVGAVLAAVAGGAGNVLARRFRADASRADVRIPAPASPATAVSGTDLPVEGLGPFFTPNDRFYRVDTALLVPAVMAEGWRLRIHGMVDREISLDYRQLLARPLIERDITLTCVSNPVGGRYVGNARWIGAPLRDLLEETGVHPGADQIVTRSVDGFTVGTPTVVATDGRDAMLAVAMNGEALPLDHGFPVRMIVPGLYGYVSATKWIVDMELTTFDAYDPYWVQRGWAERAPIKTMSRIDTPAPLARLRAGTVAVAGVAWAQHRGVEGVELRVDEGDWIAAELAAADTIDTWRQWVVRWEATPGNHRLQVRATDGAGQTQGSDRLPPFPDGATGYHTIVVEVS